MVRVTAPLVEGAGERVQDLGPGFAPGGDAILRRNRVRPRAIGLVILVGSAEHGALERAKRNHAVETLGIDSGWFEVEPGMLARPTDANRQPVLQQSPVQVDGAAPAFETVGAKTDGRAVALQVGRRADDLTVPDGLPRPKTLALGPRLISTPSESIGSSGTRLLVSETPAGDIGASDAANAIGVGGIARRGIGGLARPETSSIWVNWPVPSVLPV